MVIEDEPPILRSICNKIEEVNSNFIVVETACNGREAIEKLNCDNDIDLIFVDINLPIMNGLDVLDYVKNKKLDIFSVVLSGYKEFEYVRAAFENNALDYLLKPLKTDDLRRILLNIEDKFVQKNFFDYTKTLEEALNGVVNSIESYQERQYHLIIIKAGNFHNSSLANGMEEITFREIRLKDIFDKYFTDSFTWLANGKSELEKIAFVSSENNSCINILGMVFKSIQSSAIPITFAVNKLPISINQIYETYYKMKKFMRNNMIFCRTSLLIYNGSQIDTMFMRDNKYINKAILKCRENPEVNIIFNEIMSILKDCISKPTKHVETQYIIKRFFSILCNSLPSNKEYIQLEERIEFILINNYKLCDMKNELYFLVEDCFGNVKIDSNDKKKLVYKMKEYLDANYHFNIPNQLIAEKFGFVPSYLSSIFKSYFGLSLSDYVIMLRINEAKELLKNSNLKVKEIAEQVGYSDPLYFSKAFKKIVGMSPKEYNK